MKINFVQNLENAMEYLHSQGAFLTTKVGEKVNTMTISWGSIGYAWNKPVFTVLVRKQRYTYEFMENTQEFTVSIPLNKEMKEALMFCGTKSGREVDKFKECNLTLVKGNKVDTPIIGECELHYECKIVYKQDMDPALLTQEIKDEKYPGQDYHTLYYGEIVDCYRKEK